MSKTVTYVGMMTSVNEAGETSESAKTSNITFFGTHVNMPEAQAGRGVSYTIKFWKLPRAITKHDAYEWLLNTHTEAGLNEGQRKVLEDRLVSDEQESKPKRVRVKKQKNVTVTAPAKELKAEEAEAKKGAQLDRIRKLADAKKQKAAGVVEKEKAEK